MPPLIKRPGGIPGWQLGFVVGFGILSGIYIWKPVFDRNIKEKAKNIAEEARNKKTAESSQNEQK